MKRALVVGAAIVLAVGLAWRHRGAFGAGSQADTSYAAEGRSLLYAIPAELRHLPLSSLAAAAFEPGDAPGSVLARAVSVACVPLLAVSLGGLLAGAGGAAVSVLLVCAAAPEWAGFDQPQTLFTLLIMACAGLMVLRRRVPGPWPMVGLGVVLASCLLYRSAMSLFPLLLGSSLAVEALTKKGRQRLRCLGAAAALGLVPYLALLPWLRVQSLAGHGFVAVELGQAESNLVVGSLGMPFCLEGDWRKLVPPEAASKGVWAWAVSETAGHPLRTAKAVAARLRHVAGRYPWLLLLAMAGFWLGRSRPGAWETCLLACYLLAVHAAMAIKDDYLRPWWPVLACLAGAGASLAAKEEPRRRVLLWAAPSLLVLALTGPALLWLETLLARYPGRSSGTSLEGALSTALEAGHEDSWLRLQRGEARLRRGDLAGASSDFARASELRPGQSHWALKRAWLKALSGDRGPLSEIALHGPDSGLDERLDRRLFNSHAALKAGLKSKAQALLAEAVSIQERDAVMPTLPGKTIPLEVRARLSARIPALLNRISANMAGLPASERLGLLELLAGVRPEDCGFLLAAAEAAVEAGSKKRAEPLLSRAEQLCGEPEDRSRMARAWQVLRETKRSLALYEAAASKVPGSALAWVEYAEAAAGSGKPDLAGRALARALDLGPDEEAGRRAVSVFRKLGQSKAALDLAGSLVKRYPASAGLWLEHALAAASEGRREQGLSCLEKALSLGLSGEEEAMAAFVYSSLGEHRKALALFEGLSRKRPGRLTKEDRHRVALVYQALREYGQCGRVLAELIRAHPLEPKLHSDLAVCSYLGGAKTEAVSQLRRALELDPWFLPAAWSYGSILVLEKREAEALTLYDRVLLRPSPREWEGLRGAMETERKALRARRSSPPANW
ncbi:MAG: hypothetical protein HY924_03485 [Elusimicrobia bacterium]|nr:hypothetical protein [Elusimicrobiota bacterium]